MHLCQTCCTQCRGGGTIKDIYLEQINVSNGGKSLIEDSELMLAHGRRYGVVGRNGTGAATEMCNPKQVDGVFRTMCQRYNT